MNIVFFKRPKPKPFNYRPIYFDPEKEEAEDRKKALGLSEDTDPRERMRAGMRRSWRRPDPVQQKGYGVIRIFFYMVFFAFSIYFIFFTDYINRLVSFFTR
jgi:hypothetical protein